MATGLSIILCIFGPIITQKHLNRMLSQLIFKLCGRVTVDVTFYLLKFSVTTEKIRVLGTEVRPPSWKMFCLPWAMESIQS